MDEKRKSPINHLKELRAKSIEIKTEIEKRLEKLFQNKENIKNRKEAVNLTWDLVDMLAKEIQTIKVYDLWLLQHESPEQEWEAITKEIWKLKSSEGYKKIEKELFDKHIMINLRNYLGTYFPP